MQATNDIVKDLHNKAEQYLKVNKNRQVVIELLVKEGITADYAETILDNLEVDKYEKKEFYKELFKGISITLVGLLLNILSYTSVLYAGGFIFIVFWGIVVTGITLIFRAFIYLRKS